MEYFDEAINDRIRSRRLVLKGIPRVARGTRPNALVPAMYARNRFSKRSSYGMFKKTDSGLCFRLLRTGCRGISLGAAPCRFARSLAFYLIPARSPRVLNCGKLVIAERLSHEFHKHVAAVLRDAKSLSSITHGSKSGCNLDRHSSYCTSFSCEILSSE